MDELEQLAAKHDGLESEAESLQQSEPVSDGKADGEAAANMAESLLRLGEGCAKVLLDPRLCLDDSDIDAGRESLSPVIDKHDLAVGSGKMPYQEEITAGFFLGGLIKRMMQALRSLRERDKAKQRERDKANHGDQREHQTTEPTQPVPGPERVREEPNPKEEGWSSEPW